MCVCVWVCMNEFFRIRVRMVYYPSRIMQNSKKYDQLHRNALKNKRKRKLSASFFSGTFIKRTLTTIYSKDITVIRFYCCRWSSFYNFFFWEECFVRRVESTGIWLIRWVMGYERDKYFIYCWVNDPTLPRIGLHVFNVKVKDTTGKHHTRNGWMNKQLQLHHQHHQKHVVDIIWMKRGNYRFN